MRLDLRQFVWLGILMIAGRASFLGTVNAQTVIVPSVPASVRAMSPGEGFLQRRSLARSAAADLAAPVVDAAIAFRARKGDEPSWQELDSRLGKLCGNSSKEADEAIVILRSFYLGEAFDEQVSENLLSRGPRMIPILERYLREEPASLLAQYPERVRLERATTVNEFAEALDVLRFRAGARSIAGISVGTSPLREQTGKCELVLVKRPELKVSESLAQQGELYNGETVLRVDIDESGDTTGVQLLGTSGIPRLDALLLTDVRQWKYAPRPNCGVAQANVGIAVHWAAAR